MKKITFLILFTAIIFLRFDTRTLLAQQATSSAINEKEIQEKIKEKLEDVVAKDFSGDKKITTTKTYGYAGRILNIQNRQIVLETILGNQQNLEVASQAAILKTLPSEPKTNLSLKDLEVNQFIIALGNKINQEILLAKRLIVTNQPSSSKRKILWGKVTQIDEPQITIKTDGEEKTISLEKKTKLKIAGIENPKLDHIQIGDQLAAIITINNEGKLEKVKVVLVIPGEKNPFAKENSIVEATPSASPL